MQKTLLLLSVLTFSILLCAGDTVAQIKKAAIRKSKASFGVQGGLNVSNVFSANTNSFGDNNFAGKAKAGFNFGLFGEIPIITRLNFEPELNYSLKGYKAQSDRGVFTRNYDFLDIPLNFKFYATKEFFLFLGPQISFKVGKRDVYTNNDGTFIYKYQRRDDQLRQTLLGVNFGAGIDFSKKVLLNGGFSLDGNQSYKETGLDTPGFRNFVFYLRLAYKF